MSNARSNGQASASQTTTPSSTAADPTRRRRRPRTGRGAEEATRVSRPAPSRGRRPPASFQARGVLRLHPHGFGFADLDAPSQLPSAFVPPSLARRFVDGDLVEVDVAVEDDGRGLVLSARMTRRTRMLLAGIVGSTGPGQEIAVDPALSTSAWRLPADGERLPKGSGVVFAITSPDGRRWEAAKVVAGPFDITTPAWARALASVRVLDQVHVTSLPASFRSEIVDPDAILHADAFAAVRDRDPAAATIPVGERPARSTGARRDRGDVACFTVDGPSTRDLDDAVFAEAVPGGVRVEVHIADVAAAVPAGSTVDAIAAARATSTYLAGRNIPMLPRHLSDDELSLLPGERRDTLAVSFVVPTAGRDAGEVCDVEVFRASMRSAARLTYTEVEGHLVAGDRLDAPAAVRRALDAAADAADALDWAREARSTLDGLFVDAELVIRAEGSNAVARTPDVTPVAQSLIERLMVAANEAVASWLDERDLPAMFRTHAGLAVEDLGAMEAFAGGLLVTTGAAPTAAEVRAIQEELDRTDADAAAGFAAATAAAMGRARYQATPEHHFGLDSRPYCHFTSPIRRYADLIVHRVVHAALDGVEGPYPLADLEAMAEHLATRNGVSARAEGLERALLWGLALGATLAGGGAVTEDATVVRLTGKGAAVRINRLGVAGFVPSTALGRRWALADDSLSATATSRSGEVTTFQIGAGLAVDLASVEAVGGRLSFEPAG